MGQSKRSAKTNKYIEMPTSPLQKFMTLQGSVIICVMIWQDLAVVPGLPTLRVWMNRRHRMDRMESTGCGDAYGDYSLTICDC